eukprot:2771438-Pleurochrysis_carterae.AAC.1
MYEAHDMVMMALNSYAVYSGKLQRRLTALYGRGHAAWRGTTSMALSNYVCDSATTKYGKKIDIAVALKELKGNDSAARFRYARSHGMCC